MKCPVCTMELEQAKAGNITVDVCQKGCGGIWFDASELSRLDDAQESAGESLLNIKTTGSANLEAGKKKACPKCKGMIMSQRFSSLKRKVTVDQCYGCMGIWLDAGELVSIRTEFQNDPEKEKAFEKYYADVIAPQLDKEKLKNTSEIEAAKKVARVFRFICPSNYIPGKQSWGAF